MYSALLCVMLLLAPIQNANVFWFTDGTVQIKQNTKVVWTGLTTEPSYSRTVLAYIRTRVEFGDGKIYISRNGMPLKVFEVKE